MYIIIAKGFRYTPKGVMRYKGGVPPLMIYTLKRDDIPSLSAWVKKFRKHLLSEFFGTDTQNGTGLKT